MLGGVMPKNPLLWTVPGLLIGLLGALPSFSAVPPHKWDSDTIALRADIAAKAMNESQYTSAENAYRALIGLDPKEEDFYLGLYTAAYKAEHWDAASLALEELIDKKPELKGKIAKQLKEIFEKLTGQPMLRSWRHWWRRLILPISTPMSLH
jgi:hypothetical protein